MQMWACFWRKPQVSQETMPSKPNHFSHITKFNTSELRTRKMSNQILLDQEEVSYIYVTDLNNTICSLLLTSPLHLSFIRFVSPCRSLCESVRDSCAPIMGCYGYPWPEILRCDQFPADHLMCISSITNTSAHVGGRRGKKLTMETHSPQLALFC